MKVYRLTSRGWATLLRDAAKVTQKSLGRGAGPQLFRDAADEIERLAAENARLTAIVSLLDKTADGKFAVLHSDFYHPDWPHSETSMLLLFPAKLAAAELFVHESKIADGTNWVCVGVPPRHTLAATGDYLCVPVAECFTTPEAALAAKEQA